MRITKIGIPPGGDTNQVLVKSSGTDYDVEWGTGSGTATPPGGLNTQVQFNDGGVFGGDAGFTYNKTTNRLTLGSLVLNDVVDPGVDTDKFLVLTSLGVVSYRNGASVLVDIGGVPTTRTLTINGTSYDLSANRTWSVGTVTSVGITAGTGINVSGSPITGSGSITVTNTAPDQTVSLTQGGTTTITGTYPNFTISSADQYVGTVTSIATSAPITGGTITGSGTIGITQASGSSDGYLSSGDWTNFNNKQNALTNPVTGTGTSGQVAYFNGTTSITSETALFWDSTNDRLGIGTPSPGYKLHVYGADAAFDTAGAMRLYVNRTAANVASIIFTTGGPGIANGWAEIGQTDSDGDLYFKANPSAGSFTSRMVIKGYSGNVLINTTTDSVYKLDVNGTGRFSNILNVITGDQTTSRVSIQNTGTNGKTVNLIAGDPNVDQTGFSIAYGNTNIARFDNSGNLGLGVTPSAWASGTSAIDLNTGTSLWNPGSLTQTFLATNAYFDNTDNRWEYKGTGSASYYHQIGNEHRWNIAPSGTAGNAITFTQAMTLDASGRLGIGVTPTVKLQVETPSSGNGVIFRYTGGTNNPGLFIQTEESTKYVKILSSGSVISGQLLQLGVNSASVSIDTSGNLGLGVTPSAWVSSWQVIQGNSAGSFGVASANNGMYVMSNAYYNTSGNPIYTASNYATMYQQINGGHYWYYTGSGTAGNTISWTTGMQLTANGDLIIGSGADTGESLQVTGDAKISTINNATTDTDRFLVSDSGVIKYRTGAQLLSDIGGGSGTIGGSGTTNYIPKFTGSSTIGDSNIRSTGSDAQYFNTYKGSNSDGRNILIGTSNNSLIGAIGETYKGSENISLGQNNLDVNTTGYQNTAIGGYSLFSNTTGYFNTGLGKNSLYANTTGYSNTSVGVASLSSITTGYKNTAIGEGAGDKIIGNTANTTSYDSVYLGYGTKASANGNNNEIVIGSLVEGNGSNTTTIGNSVNTTYTNKINLTGGQLTFPATQNASADANTLDDYEENTWTPAFGNTGASITYATNGQVGAYTKIGRQVTCTFRLALSTSTMTGNALTITGLPFTSANVTNQEFICAIAWTSSVTSFVNVQARIGASTNVITLLKTTAASANSTTAMVGSDIGTGSVISGTITYFV